MGATTKIEWCDKTFNPWWGCVKVSPACDHCYAESFAKRVGHKVWGKDSARRFFGPSHWAEPLKWDRQAADSGVRYRVFCASMADVMEDRADLAGERELLWRLIESTPNLDWLLLTKRPQNFRRMLPKEWLETPRPNVWLMTTVESNDYLWRVSALLSVPAAVHGVSYEPAIGALYLAHWMKRISDRFHRLDWVIAGGESGGGARGASVEWFRSVRDQCVAARVAFLFKQWGERGADLVRIGKKQAGRSLDGVEWNQFPVVGGEINAGHFQ